MQMSLFNTRAPATLSQQVRATNKLTGSQISDILRECLLEYVRQHLGERPVHVDDVGWIDPFSLVYLDPTHPETSRATAASYRRTPTGRWGVRRVVELTNEQARLVLGQTDDDNDEGSDQ
jgi:hypothetical protein